MNLKVIQCLHYSISSLYRSMSSRWRFVMFSMMSSGRSWSVSVTVTISLFISTPISPPPTGVFIFIWMISMSISIVVMMAVAVVVVVVIIGFPMAVSVIIWTTSVALGIAIAWWIVLIQRSVYWSIMTTAARIHSVFIRWTSTMEFKQFWFN